MTDKQGMLNAMADDQGMSREGWMEIATNREHPILFSGPMIRAIMAGEKTQTRRVMKPQPSCAYGTWVDLALCRRWKTKEWGGTWRCPYGVPGDRLWVRENWDYSDNYYAAQAAGATTFIGPEFIFQADDHANPGRWKPSIHMPRRACRLFLCLTEVRIQKIQEITESDTAAEGCRCEVKDQFGELWDSINGKRASWKSNPWVWVLKFKRCVEEGG